MKKCPLCGLEQPETEFYRGGTYCRPCRAEYMRNRYREKLSAERKALLDERRARFKLPPGVKRCKVCRTEKPYSEFHSKGKEGYSGRDSHCKDCRNARTCKEYADRLPEDRRAAYLENQEARRQPPEVKAEWPKIWAKRLTELRKRRMDSLKWGKPCADCGGVFPPEAMDFDHLPGYEKCDNVSKLVRHHEFSKAQEEVKKCELVCSNCHRVRTARRAAGLPFHFPPPDYEI